MKTEIIAVGSELLSPFFQDTDSLLLTEGLNGAGLSVSFKTVVGDDDADLDEAVRTALRRSRLILVIGGLGPTEDDRTREAFARGLGRKLVFHREILEGIRERFRRRGYVMTASNRRQCYVIDGAEVLPNPNGTAPGQWIATRRNRIALLPGPPHEMRPMFEDHVLPRVTPPGARPVEHRVLRLTGIGESLMETKIRDLYGETPPGVRVTTLASPGELAIHLILPGPGDEARAALDAFEAKIVSRLGRWMYSGRGKALEAVVGRLLTERGATLACAESCTGGLLAHRLTNVPGSSAYFLESCVTYANRAKVRRLRVPAALIERHGAVSAPVARAMAAGIRATAGSDFGLAITGIAGPDGGSPKKPVGLVYIALAHRRSVTVTKSQFWGGRNLVKFQSSQKALDILRRHLIKSGQKTYNRAKTP